MVNDTLLYNTHIHTLSAETPIAQAILIRGNRILEVFNDPDPRAHVGPDTTAIDLSGSTIIPGLTDAHVHFSWFSTFLNRVNLLEAESAEHAAQLVGHYANSTDEAWIEGRGWSQDTWPAGQFPDKTQLDAVIAERPVYLIAHSGHAAWVNSQALQQAGITASTADPAGGRIGRTADGSPDGMLYETAMDLVREHIPRPTPDTLAERVKAGISYAHAAGLTGIHDFDGALAFAAYQVLHQAGDLTLRMVKNIPVELLDHAIALGLRWGFGDDVLRIGGVKTFADGALGVRTAWMIDPYEGEPDNRGICVTDPEEMTRNVLRASQAGLPSTIHAIGDKAVHEVLNVYQLAREDESKRGVPHEAMRHRIEHVQVIHPEDVNRLGQLGIIASMQPNHATSDMVKADQFWGDRAEYAYNMRLQVEAGAPLALGSDAPIEPIDPLANIQAAVTRRRLDGSPGSEGWRPGEGGHHRLTVDEALRGFTQGPAYAAGMENRLGMLVEGYLADLVVLDQDIYTVDPMTIHESTVRGTMVGGEWVYRIF